MNLKDIGLRIKFIRINKMNYTQEDFATLVGLDKAYICRVENGKQNLTVENLIKICKGLNVSLSEFFDFNNVEIVNGVSNLK